MTTLLREPLIRVGPVRAHSQLCQGRATQHSSYRPAHDNMYTHATPRDGISRRGVPGARFCIVLSQLCSMTQSPSWSLWSRRWQAVILQLGGGDAHTHTHTHTMKCAHMHHTHTPSHTTTHIHPHTHHHTCPHTPSRTPPHIPPPHTVGLP